MENLNLHVTEISFKVKNIANAEQISKTKRFDVRENTWYLKVQKQIDPVDVNRTSVIVQLGTNSLHGTVDRAVIVLGSIKLQTSRIDRESYQKNVRIAFTSKNTSMTCHGFILWNDLMNPNNGYINNGMCQLQAEFYVSSMYGINEGAFMDIQPIWKCCDSTSDGTYRFIVKRFDEFPGVLSPRFTLCDISWQIFIYKAIGTKSGDKIRVQLCDASEKENWSCEMNMDCKLIPFDVNTQPVQKTIKNMIFESTSTKTLDLIKWSQFNDVNKRFIENNSFVIELNLKVKRVEGVQTNSHKKCCYSDERISDTAFIKSKWNFIMECPICLEDLFIDRAVSSTKCGHMFCTECIENSLGRNEECPSCMKIVGPDDLHPIYFPDTKLVLKNRE